MTPQVTLVLTALVAFELKHFFCDFCVQTLRQVQEKGVYGKVGGIQHAGLHALLSIPPLYILTHSPEVIAAFVVGEFVLHYHVDWAKAQIDRIFQLTVADQAYWTIFGLDQLIHQATYIAMIWAVIAFHL